VIPSLSRTLVGPLKRMDRWYREAYREARKIARVSRPLTMLIGPKHLRSLEHIEIDLTYVCNLKCINCNRSCRQAPSTDHMTVNQIRKFINESAASQMKWRHIRLLGGEPTLHPDLMEILSDLLEYKRAYSPMTKLKLATNGHGKKVNEVLARLPGTIEIENSMKEGNVTNFAPFNMAPRDSVRYRFADYSNGCRIIEECGIGLTPYGYYCCAIAGSIDRVFGFDLGRKTLPLPSDFLMDQLKVFCGFCGHFVTLDRHHTEEEMTERWKSAYKEYSSARPRLSRY